MWIGEQEHINIVYFQLSLLWVVANNFYDGRFIQPKQEGFVSFGLIIISLEF